MSLFFIDPFVLQHLQFSSVLVQHLALFMTVFVGVAAPDDHVAVVAQHRFVTVFVGDVQHDS